MPRTAGGNHSFLGTATRTSDVTATAAAGLDELPWRRRAASTPCATARAPDLTKIGVPPQLRYCGAMSSDWLLDEDNLAMASRLAAAVVAGGLIGLERSYHGRPAGFRTHVLVALSTALLMVLPIYGLKLFPEATQARITLDPTRMAQGIMTGIGFLGAGAILRDGLTIRGLTTAASIWITAAIGILIGAGFYYPSVVATVFTLGTLSVFRWIEARLPIKFYAHFNVRFGREATMPEGELRALVARHGFQLSNLHYRLDGPADCFEYRMVIQGSGAGKARTLTETLSQMPAVRDYTIAPTGD
jgi:putative Mg2+ transporter-C (MgtC) family protein